MSVLREPMILLDDLKKIAKDYPEVLSDFEKIEIEQDLFKSYTYTTEYCEALLKRMLSVVWQLPVDRIYEAVARFTSVQNTYRRFFYFDEYAQLMDQLPGGRSFTTVEWNARFPNDRNYILSELEMRKKIPYSYTYSIQTTNSWRYSLKMGKAMNAFGCSHLYNDRARVTFYFEDETDEMLMRVRYPSPVIAGL